MRIVEKTSIRVSIKELPPMRVAANRVMSSSPERCRLTNSQVPMNNGYTGRDVAEKIQ